MKGASGTGISLINIANGMLHPKTHLLAPSNVLRQEIDCQFFNFINCILTPKKEVKKKWGLLVDLITPKTRHRIHICQSKLTVEVKFPANSTINTWDHNTTHFTLSNDVLISVRNVLKL
jgi:hypothetical protein